MSKRNIWIFAFISGAVVLALILVQLVWIRDAIQLQNRQFDQLVVKTLSQIISKLEDREANEIWARLLADLNKAGETAAKPDLTDSLSIENKQYVIQSTDALQGYYYLMDPSSFNVETKIDLISGDTLFFLRENTLYNTPDGQETESLTTPAMDVEETYLQLISNKKVFIEKAFSQMVRNEKAIDSRISYALLDSTIREEFDRRSIDLPYENRKLKVPVSNQRL